MWSIFTRLDTLRAIDCTVPRRLNSRSLCENIADGNLWRDAMGLTVTDRVDELDVSLFKPERGGTSGEDRRSLLAVHAAVAGRGQFRYLEIGSYLGTSLQSFIVDPRCVQIVSIDRRDAI